MRINQLQENNNKVIGYHGSTNTNIKQFSQEYRGKNTNATDTKFGTFFFSNPEPAFAYLETLPIDYIKDDPQYQQYIYKDIKSEYNKYYTEFKNQINQKIPELKNKENPLLYIIFHMNDDTTISNQQKNNIRTKLNNDNTLYKNFQQSYRLKTLIDKNKDKEIIQSEFLLYGAIYKCELNISPSVFDMNGNSYTQKQYNLLLSRTRDEGNNSIIIKNVYDSGDLGPKSDVIIVFDDKQINIIDKTIYKNHPAPRWMKHTNDY